VSTKSEVSLKDAIEWFSSLSSEKKAQIISVFPSRKEFKKIIGNKGKVAYFSKLIMRVRRGLESSSKEPVIQDISNLGMERSYAVALVKKVAEEMPPIQFHIRKLTEIPDSVFTETIRKVIRGLYLERTSIDEVSKTTELSKEILNSVSNVVVHFIMRYLRGEMSLKDIKEFLTANSDIKDKESANFVEVLEEKAPTIRDKLVFGNVQEILFKELKILRTKQEEIISILKELLEEIKKSSRGAPKQMFT